MLISLVHLQQIKLDHTLLLASIHVLVVCQKEGDTVRSNSACREVPCSMALALPKNSTIIEVSGSHEPSLKSDHQIFFLRLHHRNKPRPCEPSSLPAPALRRISTCGQKRSFLVVISSSSSLALGKLSGHVPVTSFIVPSTRHVLVH